MPGPFWLGCLHHPLVARHRANVSCQLRWMKAVSFCVKYIVFKTCRGLRRVLLPSGWWAGYYSSTHWRGFPPPYSSLYRPATWFAGPSAKWKYEIVARIGKSLYPSICPPPQPTAGRWPTGIVTPMPGPTWCLDWEFPQYKYQVESKLMTNGKTQALQPVRWFVWSSQSLSEVGKKRSK